MGSQIFVLDVGNEIRIDELAKRLLQLRDPEHTIPIVYGEPQPGEKLRESVIGENERLISTAHPKFMIAASDLRINGAELRAAIRELDVDRRRRTGNIPARLHAIARLDRTDRSTPVAPETEPVKPPLEA
jgi:FlaA1/EpsC-like NDP-sugar epimerase